jgi:tetratricopeptide (TPR) repeat protein
MIRELATTTAVLLAAGGLAFTTRAEAPPASPAPPAASGLSPGREAAYRENNLGVAYLEQYNNKEAVEAFRRALEQDPTLQIARVNLAIALFYVPDLPAAKAAATEALAADPESPRVNYVLALVARLEDHPDAAEAHLRKVLAVDPNDFGANLVLGQVLIDRERFDEALPFLDKAASIEPYNASVAYSRAMALGRGGRRAEAMEAMKHFQAIRANPSHTSFGKIYLEQGRYAEAVVSTGAESELVDPRTPHVDFAEKKDAIPARPKAASPVTLALADLDDDGRLDAIEALGDSVRLLHNEGGGRFADVTGPSGVTGPARAAVAGDYDNDGDADLLLVRPEGLALFRNEGGGRFVDVTAAAKIPARAGLPPTAAFADVDHDGDLDVVLPGLLLQNDGNGTFTDVTARAGLAVEGDSLAVVPTDFDDGRDLDVVVLRREQPPLLLSNMRDGTFADVAARVGLAARGPFRAIAAADLNKDSYPDFVLGTAGETAWLAMSDGRGRFVLEPGPAGSGGALAVQAFDYDNDGLLDLLFVTEAGPRLFRSVGRGFTDVSSVAFAKDMPGPGPSGAALGIADLDGDGDEDLLLATSTGAHLLVNEGGDRNRSFALRLEGRVTNKGGVGAKIDLRAGSLKEKIETSDAVPMVAPADVLFGLGERRSPDTVRVIWVSGIVQTETDFEKAKTEATRTAMSLLELDRKPSSCPYLYAWDGERFAFVTDFLGAGEMGYWEAPGVRNRPDPVEYVRLAPGQLRPHAGRYELRVTNELEEVLYLDRVRLLAVEHPRGVEVYPDEGMTEPPKKFRLFAVRDPRVPRVTDASGRDATEAARAVDRRFVEGFPLLRIRGYAEEHALTLDLAGVVPSHPVLLLTGWTDYAFSSDNVAASQGGLALKPPRLEVETAPGRWKVAVEDIGIPVGRPQTLVVDLAPLALRPGARLRLVTNMRIYWDRIAVADAVEDLPLAPVSLDPAVATLRERGFSREILVDGKGPLTFDYATVGTLPWKMMPGRYTREGDVRTLLAAADDLFVVSRPGDEVALSFPALPPVAPGRERTFLVVGDGFSKEMDINSASPDVVEPLPFHGMPRYPYSPAEAPARLSRRAAAQARYDTRVVARPLPSLELAARDRIAPAPAGGR